MNASRFVQARESGIRTVDATTLRLATISPPSLSCRLSPSRDQRRHRLALLIRQAQLCKHPTESETVLPKLTNRRMHSRLP